MKILLINKFHYKRGGSETYYFALAEALKAKGHEVIYFAMKDDKNIPCDQKEYFVSNVDYNREQGLGKKISLGVKTFYSFEAKKKIKELVEQEKPDIAHIGLLHRQITFSVVDVLKEYNIPTVMMIHDLIYLCPNYTMLSSDKVCSDCVSKGLMNCISKKCVKNSYVKSFLATAEAQFLKLGNYYNKVDLYIAECKMYQKLMRESNFTTSPIICMTNFLPINQVYEYNSNYEDYILYFGRLSKEKGVLTLLKAHQQMKCKYRLIIVGSGPAQDEIKDYIQKHNLTNVELPGAIYGIEMEELIKRARTIVIPSQWYENCPYSLLESLAKGKIVIASKIGGLPELVKDKETGFLFEAGNVEDLVKKINIVMSMKKREYHEMSKRILETAKKKFAWETYIDKLLKEYKKLIKNHKKSCVE